MLQLNILLLFNYILITFGTISTSSSSSVLHQLVPCSTTTSSSQPCTTRNNCSGQQSESCIMVVSLPPNLDTDNEGVMDIMTLEKPTSFEVWTLGLASVGIISLSGVTGALLWPAINSPIYKYVMASLIGLAVGSLTSTAMFQLIPEAFKLTTTENYLPTALVALFSIWIIYVIEAVSKLAFHKSKATTSPKIKEIIKLEDSAPLKERIQELSENQTEGRRSQKIGAVAWMIIFGDGLHNFIDGMTIGAGYSQSIPSGIGLSIAIACEEFPHELGDFAILLQSGMSITKAITYNFLSACTAFIGLVLGILLGQLEESHYIFSFAGGLFLYISLTHLIPEMKAMLTEQLNKGRKYCFIYIILQNIGMLIGVTIIYLITRYNDAITGL